MIWINTVVGGVCGILAAVIAALIIRNKEVNKRLYPIMVAILTISLFSLYQALVAPVLQNQYTTSSIEETLSKNNPAFAAVKKYDADHYEQIMNEIHNAISKGFSETEVTAALQVKFSTLVQKHLPHASDEAAVRYIEVTVQELIEAQQNDGNLCYELLFPQLGQTQDISKFISASTQQADLSALGEVVRTSAVAPQEVPKDADMSALLESIITILLEKYGQDAALLQNPIASGIDKSKVCRITIDMYKEILQLPPTYSGKLLRYLMAQD